MEDIAFYDTDYFLNLAYIENSKNIAVIYFSHRNSLNAAVNSIE